MDVLVVESELLAPLVHFHDLVSWSRVSSELAEDEMDDDAEWVEGTSCSPSRSR